MKRSNSNSFYVKHIKRTLDFCIALISLIILSPIMAIIAVLVRLKLGSPVIFKQERPGLNERIFTLYKFRSMSNACDKNGELLSDTVRLTRFGRLLRATSLDELPELFNILKGDMSIIGPRPLSVEYLPYYSRRERARHSLRPGLTGLAQVNGRNALAWTKRFKLDVEYVDNCSFLLDCKIFLLTIKKVLIREGIGQGEEAPDSLNVERKDWLDENGNLKPEYE